MVEDSALDLGMPCLSRLRADGSWAGLTLGIFPAAHSSAGIYRLTLNFISRGANPPVRDNQLRPTATL